MNSINILKDLSTQLKLFGLRETLDLRLCEAASDNLSLEDALSLLLEDEVLFRKNKRFQRLTRAARFSQIAALENFQTQPQRGINKPQLKRLASLNFIDQSHNIILFGPTGVGKSFLAQAIGYKACQMGIDTLFFPLNKFFLELEAAEASDKTLFFFKKLRRIKVLILDDFGLRNYSHKEASSLLDVLEERYQHGSTIITSQVKPLGWKSLFKDHVIAESITDRLINCAHIFELTGDSFRKNHKPKSS